ncbi:MAG: hypothetical protein JSW04_12130 [Desulfobacterales bacterium]|nr:MAG: hypothetical protein JSW04_12130 [Desulfobacterales bacterium]
MHKSAKRPIIFVLVVALIFVPFGTSALAETYTNNEDIDAGAMAADILFARPIGLLSVVVGSALFIVSLPFSALGGNVNDASQKLIMDPVNFTFNRPLGDF